MLMVAIFSACRKDRRVDPDFKGPRATLSESRTVALAPAALRCRLLALGGSAGRVPASPQLKGKLTVRDIGGEPGYAQGEHISTAVPPKTVTAETGLQHRLECPIILHPPPH
jgi:hypothetical protein